MSTRHIDISILADTEIFSGLPEESLEDIRTRCFRKRFDSGEVVFRQGEPALNVYIVVMGQLRVAQTTADGQRVIIRYLGRGDLAGYAVLSANETHPGTVVAVEDTHAMGWTAASVHQLMDTYPRIAMNALAIVGRRYRELQERLREQATQNAERRIAHAILRLVKQAGRSTPHGIEIAFPLSRQDLAEMAATTLHTVSRTMTGWEERGIVQSRRRRVIVTQTDTLLTVAVGDA